MDLLSYSARIKIMKNVLLIDPIYNSGTIPKNISLCKIAAGLEHCGHKVSTIDFLQPECEYHDLAFFLKKEKAFIEKALELATNADIVYITSGTGNELKPYPVFPRIKSLIVAIKKKCVAKLMVGGALINLYTKVYNVSINYLQQMGIDYVVVGNEYTGAMNAITDGRFPDSVVPKWSSFENKHYPNYKSVQYHVGCPYSCDFCFEGKIHDKCNDKSKLKDFLDSIVMNDMIIMEDSVMMSYPDFWEITEAFFEKKVSYAIYARISEIVSWPDKVKRLAETGCKSVIVGIETLDNNVLQGHNKNIVSSQTRQGLDILKANGIGIQGCFMLGFPEDTIANMKNTVEFAIRENLQGYRWHIYQPNYSDPNLKLRLSGIPISVEDHFNVQLNVPDHCLDEIMLMQPKLGMLDEHFMIRGKNCISAISYRGIGYQFKFEYSDIKCIIDELFPPEWILNEEKLYRILFN